MEGAVRGVSYPLSLNFFFESMYSHVYGVKWSPWSVTFEINYLREEVRVLKYPLSLNGRLTKSCFCQVLGFFSLNL